MLQNSNLTLAASVGEFDPNQWGSSTGGAWGTQANWLHASGATGYVPDNGYPVRFLGNLTASGGTVTLGGTNRTVSSMTFDNPTSSYTIGAPGDTGAVILAPASGNAVIAVTGTQYIVAPVQLAVATSVNVAGGSSLTMSGPVDGRRQRRRRPDRQRTG